MRVLIAAVAGAAAAFFVATSHGTNTGGERSHDAHDVAPTLDTSRLDALEARLDAIEASLAERLEPPSVEARTEDLRPEIESLSARLEALESERSPAVAPRTFGALGELVEDGEPDSREREPTAEERRRNAEAVILDPASTAEEVVAAHKSIRRIDGAYTPQMIDTLVWFANSDSDDDLRARTWTMFDGRSHLPELVPHLERAARHDEAFQVRREAAETLGNYIDDPAVVTLLKDLARNDPHPEVRDRARRTLGGDLGNGR